MNFSKSPSKAKYSQVEILSNVHVSEKPERMGISKLAPEIQLQISKARTEGFRPVCVYWPDGKTALLLIGMNASLPSSDQIIRAYLHCQQTDLIFPKGVLTCAI